MTRQALLEPINSTSRDWHRLYCELAGMELTGERRLIKRITALEDLLDDLWERRRRHLALACAQAMPAHLLVDGFQRDLRIELLHVAPVC